MMDHAGTCVDAKQEEMEMDTKMDMIMKEMDKDGVEEIVMQGVVHVVVVEEGEEKGEMIQIVNVIVVVVVMVITNVMSVAVVVMMTKTCIIP